MTKEQVEELFDAMGSSDIEFLMKKVKDKNFRKQIEETLSRKTTDEESIKIQRKIIKLVLEQIEESGQYKYFEKIGLEKLNQSDFVYILMQAKREIPVQTAKEYLKKLEYSTDKYMIIKATKDSEFIKQCINDENSKLEFSEKIDLICFMGDIKYIREFIEKNNSNLYLEDKIRLIKATKNSEYIKECVENNKLNIKGRETASLIIATKDSEYIKQCISNGKRKYHLTTAEIVRLVGATKDNEYIQAYLQKNRRILLGKEKNFLILSTNDSEYAKSCIEDGTVKTLESKIDLIPIIKDYEYLKKFMKKYTKELDSKEKKKLITETKDTEYIKQCIKDKEIGISKDDEIDLILDIGDENYLLQCMTDDSIGITKAQKIVLSQYIKDKKFKQQLIKECEPTSIKDKIELPEKMTIGIEIESEGKFSRFLTGEFFGKELVEGWKSKYDGSLDNGIEVVSTILSGTEKDSKSIYTICKLLKNLGERTSERCGGHIHIGADYLTSKESYINLLMMWSNTEKMLYETSNPPGKVPRHRSVEFYATPISGKIESALKKGSINLTTENDLANFVQQIKDVQKNRYSGINFLNANSSKKNTIEFRLPNGTINPKTWIENINLFGGIIQVSENLAQIQRKPKESRDEKENQKIQLFEKLNSGDISESERIDILLNLAVGENKKEIYINRYKANDELVKKMPFLKYELEFKLAEKPITIDKIKEMLFAGNEPMIEGKMLEAEKRIALDLEREQGILDDNNRYESNNK